MRSAAPSRVVSRALDWDLGAADVLRLVRADPHPVALLGTWAGGSDIVASDPVRVCGPPGPAADVLDAPLPDLAHDQAGAAFGGGWIGYLGFALAGQMLPVLLGGDPAALKLAAEAQKFISAPTSLKVTVHPKADAIKITDFLAMSDPAALLAKINIEASANK